VLGCGKKSWQSPGAILTYGEPCELFEKIRDAIQIATQFPTAIGLRRLPKFTPYTLVEAMIEARARQPNNAMPRLCGRAQ
jgi:hypothetical protein